MVANLISVPPQKVDPHPWGEMAWLLSDADRAMMGLSLARMTVKPGARCGAHRHSNAAETVFVSAGSIDIRMRLIRLRLTVGEHQVIPEGAAHELMNLGDDIAQLMIVYSHPARAYEATSWIEEKRRARTSPPLKS